MGVGVIDQSAGIVNGFIGKLLPANQIRQLKSYYYTHKIYSINKRTRRTHQSQILEMIAKNRMVLEDDQEKTN